MATNKASSLSPVLRRLKTSTQGDIVGSCVVSTDGYLLASEMQANLDADRFSSMCASLLALADQTLTEVDIGDMQQVMIMGNNGFTVLTHAGSDAVLALSTTAKALQGRVLMESKRAAKEIGQILGTSS